MTKTHEHGSSISNFNMDKIITYIKNHSAFFKMLLLLKLGLSHSLFSWQLIKEHEGIKVYTQQSAGSTIKQIKIVTTAQASLSSAVALMTDKKAFTQWVYACTNSHALQMISDTESVHYQYTSMPWPLNDRDVIIHSIIHQDLVSKTVTIKSKGMPSYLQHKKDVVRVKTLEALWTFKPLSTEKLQIEYYLSMDPGGEIPSWAINMGVTEGPFKSIEKMKELLPKYERIQLSYIEN